MLKEPDDELMFGDLIRVGNRVTSKRSNLTIALAFEDVWYLLARFAGIKP